MVVVIASLSILVYDFTEEKSGGNTALSALVTLANICVMTVLCTAIDAVRRKVMVERPVKRILDATERITAGDFSVRIGTFHAWGKYDEYDVIAENLDKMAEELSKSEILRGDFIANVSHEMKTPLAVIRNYAAALADEKDEAVRREYAQTLVSESRRLDKLVTNVLRLSKLENQEIFPEKRRCSSAKRFASACSIFSARSNKKRSNSCVISTIWRFIRTPISSTSYGATSFPTP